MAISPYFAKKKNELFRSEQVWDEPFTTACAESRRPAAESNLNLRWLCDPAARGYYGTRRRRGKSTCDPPACAVTYRPCQAKPIKQQLVDMPPTVEVVCHKGANRAAPENTFAVSDH